MKGYRVSRVRTVTDSSWIRANSEEDAIAKCRDAFDPNNTVAHYDTNQHYGPAEWRVVESDS